MIDLRSDTFSLPTPEMRAYMAAAVVGDEYYREDPSVRTLEEYCADLFRKEAGLFTTSGMLANQLAVAVQVQRGNEVVTDYTYHMHLFEGAQYASLCHVLLNARHTADGVLRASDADEALHSKPREALYAQCQLVTVENTIASRQGKVFPFDALQALRQWTYRHGVRLHLDGARIFNAHVASGVALCRYAEQADTLTVSFSKALGAPFGSMLLGPSEVIERARRLRMQYGSGFHQVGVCAAAAYFALTRQFTRLEEDHRLAKLLAGELNAAGLAVDVDGVETNMVFVDLAPLGIDGEDGECRCRERGVLLMRYPPRYLRMVVCRNVDEDDINEVAAAVADALHP